MHLCIQWQLRIKCAFVHWAAVSTARRRGYQCVCVCMYVLQVYVLMVSTAVSFCGHFRLQNCLRFRLPSLEFQVSSSKLQTSKFRFPRFEFSNFDIQVSISFKFTSFDFHVSISKFQTSKFQFGWGCGCVVVWLCGCVVVWWSGSVVKR